MRTKHAGDCLLLGILVKTRRPPVLPGWYCMDARPSPQHHALVRVLAHIALNSSRVERDLLEICRLR
jgi:hypothetical protein